MEPRRIGMPSTNDSRLDWLFVDAGPTNAAERQSFLLHGEYGRCAPSFKSLLICCYYM
jgi:hypothetical protein